MTISDDALAVSITVLLGLAGVAMSISATFDGGPVASAGMMLPVAGLLLVVGASIAGAIRRHPGAGVEP